MVEQTVIDKGDQPANSVDVVGARGILKPWFVASSRFVAGPLAVVFFALLCYSGWSLWRFGSFVDGIAFLNGYVLVAEQKTLDLGEVRVGSEAEGNFVLKNLTSEPITLVGARPECSCMIASDLPARIEPHSTMDFSVRFTPNRREASQTVTHRILLYLDVDSPAVVITFSADVLPVDETITKASAKAKKTARAKS